MSFSSVNNLGTEKVAVCENIALKNAQIDLALKIKKAQASSTLSFWEPTIIRQYRDNINCLAISLNNSYIACGFVNGNIEVLNIHDRNKDFTLCGSYMSICSIVFSPNGKYIVAGLDNGVVQIYNFKQRNLELSIRGAPNYKQVVAFSPHGQFISFVNFKTVVVWNFIERKEEFRLDEHQDTILSIAFSRCGKYLVSGSYDKLIILWNLKQRKKEWEVEEDRPVCLVAISNDGSKIAAVLDFYILKVWYTKKKKFLEKLFTVSIKSLSFSPDSNYLCISKLSEVKVYKVKNLKERFYLFTRNGLANSAIFSWDQRRLFVGCSNSTIYLWKIQFRNMVPYGRVIDNFKLIAFSKDSKYFALNCRNLEIWDIKKFKILFELDDHEDTPYSIIKFSDDNKKLLTIFNKELKIWDLINRQIIFFHELERKNSFLGASINFDTISVKANAEKVDSFKECIIFHYKFNAFQLLDYSPDGNYCAVKHKKTFIKVFNIFNWHIQNYIEEYEETLKFMKFSYDSKCLFTGDKDSFKVWNLMTGTIEFIFGHKFNDVKFTSKHLIDKSERTLKFYNFYKGFKELKLDFSIQNYKIFEISDDSKYLTGKFRFTRKVTLWKLEYFREIQKTNSFIYDSSNLKFSNNGKYAVFGFQKMIKLWSVQYRREILSFYSHKYWVTSLDFSPDSRLILSGGNDKQVIIWNLRGFKIKVFKGHLNRVVTVRFSKDGKFILSLSTEGVFKFWEIKSTCEKLSLSGFENISNNYCFFRNESYIAMKSIDEKLAIYKIR